MSVIEENWNYEFDIKPIEENSYEGFKCKIESLHESIFKLLEHSFKSPKFNYNGNSTAQSHDDELKSLIESNKHLRHVIDVKLEDLSAKKTQYENYKKDQKLLSQEIKETHEAFLMAKKYYKKFFKMYYAVESRNGATQTIFVQYFTEAKKESENYSIRLLRDTKKGTYKLLEVTPKLQLFKELQQQLQNTNDVPGALCCIRSTFMSIKLNKK